jgi:hypothetical protein
VYLEGTEEEEGGVDGGLVEEGGHEGEEGGLDGAYLWRREGRKEELLVVYLRRKEGWMVA